MEDNRIIIAFTKKSIYNEAPFWDDKTFFIRGNNFCYINCNSAYHSFSASTFIDYIRDGILLIHDGWHGDNNLESLNFEEMFTALNAKLKHNHNIYLWYHKSTEGVMTELIETFLKNKNIIAINSSSHIMRSDIELYSHIIPFAKMEITLDQIIEKCFNSKTRQDAFERNSNYLLQKLTSLSYNKGVLVNDKNAKEFIAERDKLLNKFYGV